MVGGRRVLLSIAALALDTALGGPLRHRDDGASGNSSPVSAGVQQPGTPTSIATRPSRVGIVPAPPIPPAQLAVSTQTASAALTTAARASSASGEVEEDPYPYPGQWGATEELYTNDNAPTRASEASGKTRRPTVVTFTAEPPPIATGPTRIMPGLPPSQDGAAYGPTLTPVTTPSPILTRIPTERVLPTIITVAIEHSTTEKYDLGNLTQHSTSPASGNYPPIQDASIWSPGVTGVGIGTLTATPCQPSDDFKVKTSYSIVHTSTLTWYGNPTDYTPLYPPISIPEPSCTSTSVAIARLTVIPTTFCSSTGTGTRFVTCLETVTTAAVTAVNPLVAPAGLLPPASPVIVMTTDKNPVVIFTTQKTPNYGVSMGPATVDSHPPVTKNDVPIATPSYNSAVPTTPMQQQQPSDPVTVAVRPTEVVINGNTFIDAPSAQTQTVIVSGVSFTIEPTRIVGGGATITRTPATVPTSTVLGGLQVFVSSSVAVVGGSSFSIGSTPQTAVVSGQTVRIDPTAVVVGSQTLTVPSAPRSTEVVVAGGELITAIGQSILVVRSTTITYGLSGSSSTVVDDDTITFGPGGVTVHGTTLGGKSAKAGATEFAVVGGATITRVGASVVIIGNATYTVGPGTGTTTLVAGGETITLSPTGVSVSTLDLPWPFGPTYTITPGATMTPDPSPTGSASKDAAAGLRPDVPAVVTLMCLMMGILFLGI